MAAFELAENVLERLLLRLDPGALPAQLRVPVACRLRRAPHVRIAIGEKAQVRGLEEPVREGVAHVGDGLAEDRTEALDERQQRLEDLVRVAHVPLTQARSTRAHGAASRLLVARRDLPAQLVGGHASSRSECP